MTQEIQLRIVTPDPSAAGLTVHCELCHFLRRATDGDTLDLGAVPPDTVLTVECVNELIRRAHVKGCPNAEHPHDAKLQLVLE